MPNSGVETIVPPITAFRFEVVLNLSASIAGVTNPVCDAAFQECSGLEMTMEPKTLTEGGAHHRQIHRIGPVSYGRLALKRGMTANHHLWNWFSAAAIPGKNPMADGQVRVLNADGTEALVFVLEECLPVKVGGPSLNAQSGQIAIEELQLVYAFMHLKDDGAGAAGIGAAVGFSAGFSVSQSGSIAGGASGVASAGLSGTAGLSVRGGPGLSGNVGARANANFGKF